MFHQHLFFAKISKVIQGKPSLMLKFLVSLICFSPSLVVFGQGVPNVQINVFLQQPVSPYLPQLQQDLLGSNAAIMSNSLTSKLSITVVNKGTSNQRLKLSGSIQRLSPSPMSISVDPSYQPAQPLILTANQSKMLSQTDLESAFGNFSNSALIFDQFDWEDIRQNGVNYKLPEGFYRICIRAYDYDMPGAYVEQCVSFQICYTLSAPQFLMPFNTITQFEPTFEDLIPISPQIQFQWTMPTSTCGLPTSGLNYDFEIRKVFPGQTIQDAVNSIPVFQKKSVYTNMFLFDTILNQGVLQDKGKYIVRVKANLLPSPNSAIDIENQGYSQILAFTYHPTTKKDTSESNVDTTSATAQNPEDSGTPTIINADCNNIPVIVNTNSYSGELKDSLITVGAFNLHVNTATKSANNTYTGTGYVIWKPFAVPLSLKVSFKNIKINTAKQVYDGQVISETDPSTAQIWDQLARAANPSALSSLMGTDGVTGIQTEVQKIQTNPTQYALDKINNQTQLNFPLGINNFQQGSTSNTLAIAGINFSASGASMQVMFSMNIPEAGDWLSLAGTGFCVAPDGFDLGDGFLYLPSDKKLNLGGHQFAFKGGKNASLDTLTTTYLKLKNGSIEKIRVHATLAFDPAEIVALDASGKRIAGDSVTMNLHFNFTNWNDWIATINFNKSFEITSIPGFQINATSGLFYDHSTTQNPDGFILPQGYVLNGNQKSFKGLYIKNLSMKFPKDFAISNNGARLSLNFSNFILDNNGVSTSLSASNIIDISTGKLGGWAFSLDTFKVNVIKNIPTDSMFMLGKLKIPVSKTAFTYTCNLNTGSLSPDNTNNKLQFIVKPAANMDFSVLNSSMNLFPNSSLQIIINSSNQTIITADLNGSFNLTISNSTPKIIMPNLEFQGFQLANTKNTNGTGGQGFSYDLQALKFGGIPLTKKTDGGSTNEGNTKVTEQPKETVSGSSVGGFAFKMENFKPVLGMDGSDYKVGISFDASIDLGFGNSIALGAAAKDIVLWGVVNTTKLPEFKNVTVAGIGIKGEFGPVTVDGALLFHANDNTWGNGLEGAAMVKFPPGVEIGAYLAFGKKDNWSYFGFAANAVLPGSGIPIGPISIFGFKGGFFNNMVINESNAPSSIKTLIKGNWSLPTATPQNNKMAIQAGINLAYIEKTILKAELEVTAEFNTGNGISLSLLKFVGNADIISANAEDPGAIKGKAELQFDFVRKSFDGYFGLSVNLLESFSVQIPIWIHVGNKSGVEVANNHSKSDFAYWLYIGYPDNGNGQKDAVFHETYRRLKVNILHVGKKGGPVYLNLEANGYFCVGSELPPFPGLPQEVKAFLGNVGGSNPQGTAGGIMFGASVKGDLDVHIMPFFFKATAIIGFDMALQHFEAPQCGAEQGKFGFNNWYANGQFYAYLAASAGLYIDVWFFKGEAKLVDLKVGAALRAGLPSPTWGSGRIRVYGQVLGGLITINTGCQFEFGEKCTPSVDPLQNIQMITEVGPEGNDATIFSAPYAYFSMPMSYRGNNKEIHFEVPADKKHDYPYIRCYKFDITSIEIFDMKRNKVVTGFQASLSDENQLLTIFNPTAWNEEAKHKFKITAQAFEKINKKWGNPAEAKYKNGLIQDTTVFFTTGKGPKTMIDEDIVYSYPIRGQRFLLKNEFNRKGTFKIFQWAPSWFQVENEPDAQVVAVFTPYDGGNFIKMPITLNSQNNTLDFEIPSNLKNSLKYKLQIVVESPEKTTTKSVEDISLMKGNSSNVNAHPDLASNIINKTNEVSKINTNIKLNVQSKNLGNLDKNPNVNIGIGAFKNVSVPNSTLNSQSLAIISSSSMQQIPLQNIFTGNSSHVTSIASSSLSTSGFSVNKNTIKNLNLDSFATGAFLKGATVKIYKPAGNGRVIYETIFATSRFNTFSDKINAFGILKGSKGDAKTEKYKVAYSGKESTSFNYMNIEPSNKTNTESFDEIEVYGDVRKVGRELKNSFNMKLPPVFTIQMLDMNPGQNDAAIREMKVKALYFSFAGMSTNLGTINKEFAFDLSRSFIPNSLLASRQKIYSSNSNHLFIVSHWDEEYARDFNLLKDAYANYLLKSDHMPIWLDKYDDMINQYQSLNRFYGNVLDLFLKRVQDGVIYNHGTNYFGLVNEEWYGGFGTTINSAMKHFRNSYSNMISTLGIQFKYSTDFHTAAGQSYFNDKFKEILSKGKEVKAAAKNKETYVEQNKIVATGRDGRMVSIYNENRMFTNTAKNNLKYFKTNKFIPMPRNTTRKIRFNYDFSNLYGINVFNDYRYQGQKIDKTFIYK